VTRTLLRCRGKPYKREGAGIFKGDSEERQRSGTGNTSPQKTKREIPLKRISREIWGACKKERKTNRKSTMKKLEVLRGRYTRRKRESGEWM